ncbi:MAG: YdaS family helix-turn-helix protein [Gammaproteobacteria bacterium]
MGIVYKHREHRPGIALQAPPSYGDALALAAEILGNWKTLAHVCACERAAASKWKKSGLLPPQYCRLVEAATNRQVTAAMLRPDIFGPLTQAEHRFVFDAIQPAA